MIKPTKYIWKNGEYLPWHDATTHVLTHSLHYAQAVFEGIRAYETKDGPAIFRAEDHYKRLIDSCKIYRIPFSYTVEALIDATIQLIKKNQLKACYIRPLVYYGYGAMGIIPKSNPVETIIAVWEWGSYLGDEGMKHGIRCGISSWKKFDSQILPPLAKCVANYANASLAKQEVLENGFDEAILLNLNGTISEGPGENIFMVKNGKIFTPPLSDAVLQGITRDTVFQLMGELGYEYKIKSMTRDELFLADELFFTGTAAEITPIREVNGRQIGNGGRGIITKTLQDRYFELVQGKNKRYDSWLCHCNAVMKHKQVI